MRRMLTALTSAFPAREIPLGENKRLRVRPMTFDLRQFELEGVGNLSVMNGRAMLGLMRMETLILTPVLRDAPLFSYDRIIAMGNDTLIAEWYNTRVSHGDNDAMTKLEALKDKLKSVPERDLGAHWYDSIKLPASCSHRGRGCDKAYGEYLDEAIRVYISLLREAPQADANAKIIKTREYVDGLFLNGGPSTDAFVKALGKDKARSIFDEIIFGIVERE